MTPQPITVTQLNQYIKEKFSTDESLANVLIKGEISNFKHHYTGHMYFTLKDENCLVKCIMFKSATVHLQFIPKDGMNVIVLGTVSVFERDGVYQIYCKAMQEDGMGSLYTAYEELKAKLDKEGLFKQEHKKELPLFPKCVGVLTSNTGSVIKDIINVSTRRNPNIYIKLLPVPVQGEGAASKIAKAIQLMNQKKLADVIILARGGGSLEDLWPFNEEIVARAIYDSKLPIISAVGHETDFTIADFVADLRAPTPSAAAELVVPNISDIAVNIRTYQQRYQLALKKKVEIMRLQYEKCMSRHVFNEPLQPIQEQYQLIDNNIKIMQNSILKLYNAKKANVMEIIARIDALSPLKTLTRGYSIVKQKGEMIKSYKQLHKNDEVDITFYDGTTKAKIL